MVVVLTCLCPVKDEHGLLAGLSKCHDWAPPLLVKGVLAFVLLWSHSHEVYLMGQIHSSVSVEMTCCQTWLKHLEVCITKRKFFLYFLVF